jgi:predicted Fe-Mo cluster-binding NifX family protein
MKPVGIVRKEYRVAYRLDCADTIVVARKDGKGNVQMEEAVLSECDAIRRVQQIADLGIETLICGAVSGFVFRMFQHHGIQVIGGVIGDAQDVLRHYVNGNLRAGAVLHTPNMNRSEAFCSTRQTCKRKRMRNHGPKKGERNGKG